MLAAILITSLRGGDAGNTPLSPIAAAAERTAQAPGARVSGTGSISVAGQSLTLRFSGAYDGQNDRSSMLMEFASSAAPPAALAQISPMTAVGDGTTVYLTAPMFSGQLPEGKSWMKIDYAEFAGSAEQRAGTDAKAMLEQLDSVSPNARSVGRERLRGVVTTHYVATIDLAQSSQVEVWIDREGYVRRIAMTAPFSIPGGPATQMAIEMDFYDFGIDPAIALPGESETFDATGLARQQLEASLG
jgi:hypothetical protein